MEAQQYYIELIAMAMRMGDVAYAVELTVECHYDRYNDNDYTKGGLDIIMWYVYEYGICIQRVAA